MVGESSNRYPGANFLFVVSLRLYGADDGTTHSRSKEAGCPPPTVSSLTIRSSLVSRSWYWQKQRREFFTGHRPFSEQLNKTDGTRSAHGCWLRIDRAKVKPTTAKSIMGNVAGSGVDTTVNANGEAFDGP
jgi:hypothetical protein